MGDISIKRKVHFQRGYKGTRLIKRGKPSKPLERVPRVSRLMALAIHFKSLIDAGDIKDQAEIARLGHVTRARVTQIMNLNNLSPDIQEELLFLARIPYGRDIINEKHIRDIATEVIWKVQRNEWTCIKKWLPKVRRAYSP